MLRTARRTLKRLTSLGLMSRCGTGSDWPDAMAFMMCARAWSSDSPFSRARSAISLPPYLANWSPRASSSVARCCSALRALAAISLVFRAGASGAAFGAVVAWVMARFS